MHQNIYLIRIKDCQIKNLSITSATLVQQFVGFCFVFVSDVNVDLVIGLLDLMRRLSSVHASVANSLQEIFKVALFLFRLVFTVFTRPY